MEQNISVFKFGSCRTSIKKYINQKNITYINNFDLTHTTKEILMYLKLMYDKIDINNIDMIDCLMNTQNLYDPKEYKILMEKSDIILLEISSIKIVKKDDNYYQINRVYNKFNNVANDVSKNFFIYSQQEDEFVEDILEIKKMIGHKKLILIGHLNLNFYDIKNINGYINDRCKIDKYILKSDIDNLLPSNIFLNDDYKIVCSKDVNDKYDTYHYTEYGYIKLTTMIIEKIRDMTN
jgi:hypothetical protein